MISCRYISCAIAFTFVLVLKVQTLSTKYVSESFRFPLQNLRIFNNTIYIGGTNMIYVLNKDWSINQAVSTCTESSTSCGNFNQILIVLEERQELLVCGTGNGGICEIRSTENVRNVLRTSSQILSPMKVSEDSSRPAQGVVTENGNVMLAVSFGKGIDMKESPFRYWTYDYAISERNIKNFETVTNKADIKSINVDIDKKHLPEYIIYFKGAFQFNWFTYFVTNQKRIVQSTNYISKLASICQNDTDFRSYADMFLSCVYDGKTYNLIQVATIIDAPNSFGLSSDDKMFVGAFTRGNDPSNASGGTAICVSKISDIKREIIKAKKENALSCGKRNPLERYLPDIGSTNCINEMELRSRNYDFTCESKDYTFLYVIGNVTHTMTATYLLDEVNGQITALDGIAVRNENVLVVAGTSTGIMVQLTMKSLKSPMEVFSTVELKTPIRRLQIHADDDTIYVLGSNKVYLFSQSNCSEFTSCAETMAARNPICGWCINKQRATRRSQCTNAAYHWISSLYKCIRMLNLTSSNIPVSVLRRHRVNVNFTFEHLPTLRAGDIFKCKLVDNSGVIVSDTKTLRNGMRFSCLMPLIKEHIELKLEFFVQTTKDENIVLSEAVILCFECEKITGCADCINRSDNRCNWCNDAGCQSRGTSCKSRPINSEEFCPQLSGQRGQHYAHAGQLTSIRFQGNHLPVSENANLFIYTCEMFSAFSNAVVDKNSIFCSINAPHLADRPLLNETTNIYYGTNGTRFLLEDGHNSYVTVYNCSMLASDCSHCEALNKTRFLCGWCSSSNKCTHRNDICNATKCPAPSITAVIPRDGPVSGSTRVTIYGLNLGSSVSEIENINVADVHCKIIDDISKMDLTDYGDFESRAPSRIICRTASLHNEKSGTVRIAVNGQVSISDVIFSFKVPVVTEIAPNFGPRAGGTRVTIYGQNLGIGSRNVIVQLENKLCLRPNVTPKLDLGKIAPSNSTITCTLDNGYISNVKTVTVSIDNNICISDAAVEFTFVENPILHPISPKNAFLSGGTKLSFEGMQIENADRAKITLNHGQGIEISECIILSNSLGTCNVPKAPESIKEELLDMGGTSDRYSKYIRVMCVVHLDNNVKENVEISYHYDPIIDDLSGRGRIVKFDADDRRLKITGKDLNHVATILDITVTVGVESCVLVELNPSYITCIAPEYKPKSGIPNNAIPEVNVTIGNIQKMVGYADYASRTSDLISSPVVILSSAAASAVLIFIISIATILTCRRYRRVKSRLRMLVKQNSIKEEDNTVIRFSRLAGRSPENEYSGLYHDLAEPIESDNYNIIPADDVGNANFPELSMNKITVQIQLEGAVASVATNVALESNETDDESSSYLHPVSGDAPPGQLLK